MYNPLVTIIIPVYNGSNFIRESITSALDQTYENIEIIVVDDGSNDNGATRKIAAEFGDKVNYIYKENGGVSSALNCGIIHSQGEWISWLSHDDIYFPQKIEKQILLLTKIKQNDQLDIGKNIIFCFNEFINQDGKRITRLNEKQNINTDTLNLILSNIKKSRFNGCTFLLPKACFETIGLFNEKLRFTQDVDFWYRLLFNDYNFNCIPEVLVKYRIHRAQTTHQIPEIGLKESQDFYRWVIEKLFLEEKYKNSKNFYKLGCYIRRKGQFEISNVAFKKAEILSKNKVTFKLKFQLEKLISYLIYHSKKKIKSLAFYLLKVKG
jgi:glycosyltransferase involved in cell wall biosynthesis